MPLNCWGNEKLFLPQRCSCRYRKNIARRISSKTQASYISTICGLRIIWSTTHHKMYLFLLFFYSCDCSDIMFEISQYLHSSGMTNARQIGCIPFFLHNSFIQIEIFIKRLFMIEFLLVVLFLTFSICDIFNIA